MVESWGDMLTTSNLDSHLPNHTHPSPEIISEFEYPELPSSPQINQGASPPIRWYPLRNRRPPERGTHFKREGNVMILCLEHSCPGRNLLDWLYQVLVVNYAYCNYDVMSVFYFSSLSRTFFEFRLCINTCTPVCIAWIRVPYSWINCTLAVHVYLLILSQSDEMRWNVKIVHIFKWKY